MIFRNEKRLPKVLVDSFVWTFFKWFTSQFQLAVFSLPFSLLQWSVFIETWRAFYFVPHIFSVGVCLFGALVPVKNKRSNKKGDTKEGKNGSSSEAEDTAAVGEQEGAKKEL